MITGMLTKKQYALAALKASTTHELLDHTLFHRIEKPKGGYLRMFTEANYLEGNQFLTNMEAPGILHSGYTFVIKAIGIRSVYQTQLGGVVGVCRCCGAPWASNLTCNYCGAERPQRPTKMMPPIGLFRLEIMSRRYTNGLIAGPFFKANLKNFIVIPSQCCFNLSIELKDYSLISSLHASLIGTLCRPK